MLTQLTDVYICGTRGRWVNWKTLLSSSENVVKLEFSLSAVGQSRTNADSYFDKDFSMFSNSLQIQTSWTGPSIPWHVHPISEWANLSSLWNDPRGKHSLPHELHFLSEGRPILYRLLPELRTRVLAGFTQAHTSLPFRVRLSLEIVWRT